MTGWILVVAMSLVPQYCLLSPVSRLALSPPTRDVVFAFAGELRPGARVTVGLMDNQKLRGEFLGVRNDRLLLRPDRDRSGTLPIAFPAIHSIEVRRGGAIRRP